MPFRRRRERGSLFVGVMLMIIPVCGLLGLVADLGLSYFTMQSAHAAAEAAAIAAVRSAMDNVNAGGSYSCGSNNFLKCQAATNCATVIPSPTNSNLQNGCAYAIANGFSSGGLSGKQTVTIEANTTSPVLGVKVNYWVTVRITQQNPLTFLAVLGGNKLNVGVESTAAVVFKVPPACITSLDSSASAALTVSGGASVVLSNCAAQVNSNDGSALNCNGGGSLSAPSINVVGGAGGCSATTGAPAVSDPFGGLAPPDLTGLPNGSFDNGTNTYSPGIYKGGISVHNASVTFSPGTYILEGGGLTCNSGCTMTGTGVSFYNTCNSGACDGGSTGYKPISINGQGTVNLSAPTDSGILFRQDRTLSVNNDNEDIEGGSSGSLSGVLYFPEANLKFAGSFSGANASTVIVANTVTLAGNSSLETSLTNPPTWMPTASLLE
jgi:Flp pilus assembly protein TadG